MVTSSGTLSGMSSRLPLPEPSEGSFLSIREVAEWLGVSQGTVRAWCDKSKLPHYKIEGTIKIVPAEFAQWLEDRYHPARND